MAQTRERRERQRGRRSVGNTSGRNVGLHTESLHRAHGPKARMAGRGRAARADPNRAILQLPRGAVSSSRLRPPRTDPYFPAQPVSAARAVFALSPRLGKSLSYALAILT